MPPLHEDETTWDQRTTPRWLQPFALVLLGALIVYNLAGFHVVFRDNVPKWTALTYWSMFTVGGTNNSVVEAEGLWGDERRPLDLAALFPTRWESGYRFTRTSFKRNKGRMQILGAATCNRHPDPPDKVFFYIRGWSKVLGSSEHHRERRSLELEWDCRRSVRLPGGRRIEGVTPKVRK